MKRLVGVIIVLIMVIVLMGCNGKSNEHEGEAKTPSDSSTQKGRQYQDVIDDFEENGFTNIKTEILDDLITGWLVKDGEVESVSVEGDEEYSSGEWYPEQVEVVITYHSFSSDENEVDENSESVVVNENKAEQVDDSENESSNSTSDSESQKNEENESSSRYDIAYRVRFQDYDICYLIDVDTKEITIFSTSDKYTYLYTSKYDGDFNNGITFDWDGLEMEAHYNYVDQDSKMIFHDESGNRNEGIKLSVSIIEGYINLPPED